MSETLYFDNTAASTAKFSNRKQRIGKVLVCCLVGQGIVCSLQVILSSVGNFSICYIYPRLLCEESSNRVVK